MKASKRVRPGYARAAVGYIRVSTDEQALGCDAQRAAIEAWAAREGIAVLAWHLDLGVSGGSDLAERPGLVAALGDLRARGAGVLAIAKRDRLARDVAVAATVERAAVACGAKIVSADGAGNGDTAADAFMRAMLDAAAAYERALIRARTKAALAAKRARGERTGEVPYGFTAGADGSLIANEAEQKVIALVRSYRAAGVPFRTIVSELSRAGIVSRSGRAMQLTQIARIAKRAA